MSEIDKKRLAAVRTLEFAGYTYHGGEHWKPPLGPKPDFKALDRLREAAAKVTWFDWSDNDPDAVTAIDALRALLPKPEDPS